MLIRIFKIFSVLLISSFFLFSCGKNEADKSSKGKITLAYVEWSSEVASTNVVKAVLQEKLGYTVDMKAVTAPAMWQAVATGDADALVAAWLPTTHGSYLKKVEKDVDVLGKNLIGTRIGLVVPEYVTISSVAELEANAEKFNKEIVGIDPGAGLMSATEKAMKVYGIRSMKLVAGSGATMTAALSSACKNKEWIVVTGWTPHWKFARMQLKYLKDPKNVFGREEYISTIARKGLEKDYPDVYAFLKKFRWTPADMQKVMVWNREEGADPYKNAVRWIRENQSRVSSWLK